MSIKVLVVVIVMSIVGYLLMFVATPDRATLLGSDTSLVERSIIVASFVLILPTVPFTLMADVFCLKLGGGYSPGYSALIGTTVSSVVWATVVRGTLRWFAARRSNQSLE